MAQNIDPKNPYETVPGGGGSSIDWNDPVNGPYEWSRNGWSQHRDGLWYHSNYGTLGFMTPPAPNTRGGGGPGGSGGNVGPGGLEKFPLSGKPVSPIGSLATPPPTLAPVAGGNGLNSALQWIKRGAPAAITAAQLFSRRGTNSIDPALQQLLQMQVDRMRAEQPLRDAVTAQAMNRLRAVYPNGIPSALQTSIPQPQQSQSQQPVVSALQRLTQARQRGPSWV